MVDLIAETNGLDFAHTFVQSCSRTCRMYVIAKDGRVWISDHDVGTDTVIADSFEDFLIGILDGRIM